MDSDHKRLEARLEAIDKKLNTLVSNQEVWIDLYRESGPIMSDIMNSMIPQLLELENKGYFNFAKSTLQVLDTVVTSYSAEDVEAFGENVVQMIDIVRSATQPEVLAMASEATDSIHKAGDAKGVGVMGMLKASNDDDVQKGMAIMLELLRGLGRGARKHGKKYNRLSKMTVPKRRLVAKNKTKSKANKQPKKQASQQMKSASASFEIPGVVLTDAGYIADVNVWNKEIAEAMAKGLGVPELTDAHWVVVNWARAHFLKTSESPNIRKITKGSGVSTRELYALFPKSPGKATAKIAGLPKPVGCI